MTYQQTVKSSIETIVAIISTRTVQIFKFSYSSDPLLVRTATSAVDFTGHDRSFSVAQAQ